MAPTNKEVANLKINTLKKKKYESLLEAGLINEDELYMVVDNNAKTEYGDLYGDIENQKDLDNALYASRLHLKDMCNDVRGYETVYKLYDRREFDLSKFTVVGNPTITEDGIVEINGLTSRNNHVQVPVSLFSTNLPFKIEFPVKITEIPNGAPLYFYTESAIEVVLTSTGSVLARLRSGTSDTYWDIVLDKIIIPSTVNLNQNNLIGIIEYTGNEYRFGYKLNNVFTLSSSVQSSTKVKNSRYFIIGWNSNANIEYKGQSDLKQLSITVDGEEVFNGIKDFTQYDTYTLPSEQVITIPYTLSKDGARIVDVAYKPLVDQLYAETGKGNYIIIDETNKTFRLPTPDIYSLLEQKAAVITFRKWEEE